MFFQSWAFCWIAFFCLSALGGLSKAGANESIGPNQSFYKENVLLTPTDVKMLRDLGFGVVEDLFTLLEGDDSITWDSLVPEKFISSFDSFLRVMLKEKSLREFDDYVLGCFLEIVDYFDIENWKSKIYTALSIDWALFSAKEFEYLVDFIRIDCFEEKLIEIDWTESPKRPLPLGKLKTLFQKLFFCLKSLTQVEKLIISHIKMAPFVSDLVFLVKENAMSLRTLTLSFTDLESKLHDVFCTPLPNLVDLCIRFNHAAHLDKVLSAVTLENLQTVDFEGNSFVLSDDFCRKLQNVKVLTLPFTSPDQIYTPEFISKNLGLQTSNVPFSVIDSSLKFRELRSLKKIGINNLMPSFDTKDPTRYVSFSDFIDLESNQIERISFSFNSLFKEWDLLSRLKSLEHFTVLVLERRSKDLEAWLKRSNLKTLYIQNLDTASVQDFYRLFDHMDKLENLLLFLDFNCKEPVSAFFPNLNFIDCILNSDVDLAVEEIVNSLPQAPQLKTLVIRDFVCRFDNDTVTKLLHLLNVKFPNLRKLSCNSISSYMMCAMELKTKWLEFEVDNHKFGNIQLDLE